MNLGRRIKRIRGALSQAEFAKKLGIHVSTAQLYEAGNIPKGDVLQRIHLEFGININWLLTGRGEPYLCGAIRKEADAAEIDSDPFCCVPMAEPLVVSGGVLKLSAMAEEGFRFRRKWLEGLAADFRALVLLRAPDDSMFPTLSEGDAILLDYGRKRPLTGAILALGVGDAVLLKRVELLADGRVRITSDNRTGYPPLETPLETIRIIGRVVWFARQLIRLP